MNSELSVSSAQVQRLQLELTQKNNELSEYRNEWEKRKAGKKSLVEEELRERLRVQGREMAEQLDRMEVCTCTVHCVITCTGGFVATPQ